MLSLMRKHAGSWLIKAVLFAIAVVFVFWGVGSFRSHESNHAAKVNGAIISYDQYRKAYNHIVDQYRQAYGGQLSDEMLKLLRPKETALTQLIDRLVMLQEADRLAIRVTNEELDEVIQKIPAFLVDGVFDAARATRLLAMNNLTVDEYRANLNDDLRLNKLQQLFVDGIAVNVEEVRSWYDWYNAEVNLEYVLFAPTAFKNITLTPEEIKTYFDAHQADYMTKPQVKVCYLRLKPEQFTAAVSVSEEEIIEYYDNHPNEFSLPQTVAARHILLKLDPDADEETVARKKELAQKIQQMAQNGRDFAELAKQYSEDGTRAQGGDLGSFTRDKMVEPFAAAAFNMQAGEISAPVRTPYGWHIIKVEKVNEARTEELAAVKERIRTQLTGIRARALALAKAETIYDNVFDGDDLAAAGKSYDLSATTTGFFTRNDPPKNIGDAERFGQVAFNLEKMVLSEILELSDGIYLLQVVERIASEVPALATVTDQVRADLFKQRQEEQAKAAAEALLAEVGQAGGLPQAAAQRKLTLAESGFFKRTEAIPQLGHEEQVVQAAFHLTPSKPLSETVLKTGQGWCVVGLKERRAPDDAGFEQEKETLSQQLDSQKKEQALRQWVAELKARSKIETNQKLIN